jgi:hypothetical protein
LISPIIRSKTVGTFITEFGPIYDAAIDTIFNTNFDFVTTGVDQYTWRANTTTRGRVIMRICYTAIPSAGDAPIFIGYYVLDTLASPGSVQFFRLMETTTASTSICYDFEGELETIDSGKIIFPVLIYTGIGPATIDINVSRLDFSFETIGSNGITYDPICSLPNVVHKFKVKIDRDTFYAMRLANRDSIILSKEFQTWIDKFKYNHKEQILTGESRGYEFITECEIERETVTVVPPATGDDVFDDSFDPSFN